MQEGANNEGEMGRTDHLNVFEVKGKSFEEKEKIL